MSINPKYELSQKYHENTRKNTANTEFSTKPAFKIYPDSKVINLIKNEDVKLDKEKDSFLHTLLTRKSTRSFSTKGVSLEILSSLLSISFGLKNSKKIFRTYPSAGGRYPVEVYVAVNNGVDIENGTYHYNILHNKLELINKKNPLEKIKYYYKSQNIENNFPILIIFSCIFERTMEKYGERGYKYALLDMGHMGQNLYLTATYLNMGVVAFGQSDFEDNVLDEFLNLKNGNEDVMYSFAVGYKNEVL
ncbi:MAG: SagB/ThcOx family dehydrogenase [Defluviitaleaceae bacterium]|nr:SagB/ThcOx family dehydrogenase [Defluviitaleaceae bacterium]